MARRETSHEIERAAAEWVARIDRGNLSSEELADHDAWLNGDDRRLGAYARAMALFERMDFAHDDPATHPLAEVAVESDEPERGFPITRRKALAGLSVGALAASGAGILLLRPTSYSTRRGEIRTIPLPDGSRITLNTESDMEVAFDASRRSIRLVNGEALFEIAKDKARPFFVETAGVVVRVVGTTFTVRSTGEPVKVVVHEGLVQLSERDVPESKVMLRPNQRSIANGVKLEAEAISDEEGNKDLAWREGNVAFNGETLAQAATEFARYSEKRIAFADSEAANHKIIGLYKANDPAGFANAIALSFDLDLQDMGGTILLTSKA